MYRLDNARRHRLSGVLQVPALVVGDIPGPWRELVAWGVRAATHDPQPIVMTVESRTAGGNRAPWVAGNLVTHAEDAAPDRWHDWDYGGVLRVRYGAYGYESERYIDAHDGTYQLPPVHSVSVAARFWQGNAVANTEAAQLRCGITAGVMPINAVSYPMQTGVRIADGIAENRYRIPAGVLGYRLRTSVLDGEANTLSNGQPGWGAVDPSDQTTFPNVQDFAHVDTTLDSTIVTTDLPITLWLQSLLTF